MASDSRALALKRLEANAHRDKIRTLYMFISRCLSWEDLLLLVPDRVELLGRSRPAQDAYLEAMAKIKGEYVSVSDFIRHTRWPRQVDIHEEEWGAEDQVGRGAAALDGEPPKQRKYCVFRPEAPADEEKAKGEEEDVVLLRNEYPYWTQDDVSHWVAWSRRPMPSAMTVRLKQTLETAMSEGVIHDNIECGERWRANDSNVIYHINPVALQSIADIHHAHIFVKGNTRAS
jgi:hypothetical protein